MVNYAHKNRQSARQLGRALGYSDTWDAKTCTASGVTSGGGSPTAGAIFGRVWTIRDENNIPVQAYNKARVGTFSVGANVKVGQRIGSSELDIIEVDFARNVQDFSPAVADAFGAGPPIPPELNQTLLTVRNNFNLRPYVSSGLILRARSGWLGKLYWDDTLTIDLDSHKTSTSGEWAWVVAYIYEDSGALAWNAVTGSDLTSATKTTADIEAAVALVPVGGFPIVAVLLKDDATTMNVNDANIAEDVRNTWAFGAGGGGTDVDAIHVNVADEINQIASKSTPHDDDVIVIEDSEDDWDKKRVQIGDLPGGGGGGSVMKGFTATITSNAALTSSANKIPFDNELHDPDGVYDPTDARFTAPVTGRYWVSFAFSTNSNTGKYARLRKNGSDIDPSIYGILGSISMSREIQLDAGDYLEVWSTADANWTVMGGNFGVFSAMYLE